MLMTHGKAKMIIIYLKVKHHHISNHPHFLLQMPTTTTFSFALDANGRMPFGIFGVMIRGGNCVICVPVQHYTDDESSAKQAIIEHGRIVKAIESDDVCTPLIEGNDEEVEKAIGERVAGKRVTLHTESLN